MYRETNCTERGRLFRTRFMTSELSGTEGESHSDPPLEMQRPETSDSRSKMLLVDCIAFHLQVFPTPVEIPCALTVLNLGEGVDEGPGTYFPENQFDVNGSAWSRGEDSHLMEAAHAK